MRPSKKEIFIHVGHYKTGSTAIQEFLHTHEKELAENGFLYPRVGRPKNNRNNHGHLSLSIARQYGFNPPGWYRENISADEAFSAMLQEIEQTDAEKIIISSEEFVQLALCAEPEVAIEDLKARLGEYDVTIVMYIREPLSLLKSWFNEVNKGPIGTRNFPTFFKNLNPHFLAQKKIYQRYANAFGAQNLNVITYKNHGTEHIGEFLRAVNCSLRLPKYVPKTQVAQSLDTLEIARLAKDRRHSFEEATISDILSIAKFQHKISRINTDYDQIANLSDAYHRSELSAVSIIAHYADLLRPARVFGPLNGGEAVNLRDLAISVEDTDIELALALIEVAQIIRPNGDVIAAKVKEYNSRRGIERELNTENKL